MPLLYNIYVDTDTGIESLKQEVEELKAVTEDTNRQVRKMRRAAWWGRLWTVGLWVVFFALSGAAYFYYAQPYIKAVEGYYAAFQKKASEPENWGTQLGKLVNNFFAGATSTQP